MSSFKTSLHVSHKVSNTKTVVAIHWKGTHFKNIKVEGIHGRTKDLQHCSELLSEHLLLIIATHAEKTLWKVLKCLLRGQRRELRVFKSVRSISEFTGNIQSSPCSREQESSSLRTETFGSCATAFIRHLQGMRTLTLAVGWVKLFKQTEFWLTPPIGA